MSRRSRKDGLPADDGGEGQRGSPARARKDARHGADAFDRFYTELLGDRWLSLRECLRAAGKPIALTTGLRKPYYLDEASHTAAIKLGVTRGDLVLDMCAAPGGKTLVLALCVGLEGAIVANERSASRRARLLRVLDEHLPPEIRERVSVTGHDARRWGLHEKNRYDRVLLDAPCSSESHVLASPEHLARWSASRTRSLAQQAHAMLAAAIDATRSGGVVLYSTCAVSPLENDGVVATLLKKRGRAVNVQKVEAPWGEPTRFGWQIMPDLCAGRGPIYFSLLQKVAEPETG